MKGEARISSIYHRANGDAPQGAEADRRNQEARSALWHRLGVLVVDPEDMPSDWDRQQLINTGNKLYGHRRKKG